MDPTTLLTAVVVAIALLGADAVLYSGSVEVEVAPPPKIENVSIDQGTLASEFEDQINEIAAIKSVVKPPDIRSSEEKGIGMALAESADLQKVAYALQNDLGYKPDRLRLALFTENGKLQALVTGAVRGTRAFREVLSPEKDEPLPHFVQRAALSGTSELAPYSTALYLMGKHASDGNFQDVTALIQRTEAMVPDTPRSFERSLFENVRGLVALFKNDKAGARAAFNAAMRYDPSNPVPFLNAAMADLEFDENQTAADRMKLLIQVAPPQNPVLLSTAYMTWAAADMGLKKLPEADRLLAMAVRTNPQNSTALHLWSEEKELEGDKAAAERLGREAQMQTATFENYVEVAALYFHLSWADNQPVTRSQFSNPPEVTFH